MNRHSALALARVRLHLALGWRSTSAAPSMPAPVLDLSGLGSHRGCDEHR